MTTITINTKIFQDRIQHYLDAGISTIRVFEDDPQCKEWCESGFLPWLLENYEHTSQFGGSLFIVDLNKHKI